MISIYWNSSQGYNYVYHGSKDVTVAMFIHANFSNLKHKSETLPSVLYL